MKKLHVSPDLALPFETVTSTIVIYGGKGMGKTNLASVLVEELAANGLRFAFLDPVGVSWGLRHSVDGKGRGIEILILGGVHGDIPIEPTGGTVVADLVVDENVNVLIDVSRRPDGTMWSIGERIRFVTDYSRRLYQRQGEKRRPIMQVYDEAARWAPQTVRKNEDDIAACMGAIAVLVEEGRNVGIGVTLLTLRSARLNKDVAELADCMIAFRTVGPNSRGAVLDWLGEHVEKERLRELDATIRKLPIGSALVVSPGWLEFEGVVSFRARRTFDSSKTPKPGQQVRASGPGAKPDLGKYQARMAETIERVKAENPKELQKRLLNLERELATAKKAAASGPTPLKVSPRDGDRKRVTALTKAIEEAMKFIIRVDAHQLLSRTDLVDEEKLRAAIESAVTHATRSIEGKIETRNRQIERLKRDAASLLKRLKAVAGEDVEVDVSVRANEPFTVSERPTVKGPVGRPRALDATAADGAPTGSIRKIMVALAQHQEGLAYRRIGAFAGVSVKGGSFASWLSKARGAGWIVGNNEQGVQITDAGLAALGDYDPLPTGPDLVDFWIREIGGTPARILHEIVAVYPDSLTQDEVGQRVGVSTKGGSFASWLSKLRSRDLITGSRELRAADMFFQ